MEKGSGQGEAFMRGERKESFEIKFDSPCPSDASAQEYS